MDLTHFTFVTYVFMLLCVGIWLVGKLVGRRSQKKTENSKNSYDKEQRLFILYQNIEDMLASFEEYVEEARAETERSQTAIAQMLKEAGQIGVRTGADETIKKDMGEEPPPACVVPAPCASSVARAAYQTTATMNAVQKPEEETTYVASSQQHAVLHFSSAGKPEEKPSTKREKVAALCAKGLDKNDIAQQLGMSVREVALAISLRKAQ